MPYIKPPNQKKRRNSLIISNAGQVFGTTVDDIRKLLQPFCSDPKQLLITVPEQRSNSLVTFTGPEGIQEASAALAALSGKQCELLGGRVLTCKYAKWVPDDAPAADDQPQLQLPDQELQLYNQPIACTTEEANIPGLYIIHDFVTEQEEQQLLAHIDQQPWLHLKKRRVQHYGYKFEYTKRGVDLKQQVGAMPEWSHQVVQRVQELPDVPVIDQLTVNEYTPGVGIAPHVDAHSSFTGSILSLSLSGSCIMVFRKAYVALAPGADSVISSSTDNRDVAGVDAQGAQQQQQQQQQQSEEGDDDRQVNVYLPPRCLVVMTGESRYAWQHYIPHRKADWVKGQQIVRADRRVSLTFRKVRGFPCDCQYPKYCDSQLGVLPPPRVQQLLQQQQQEQQQDDQKQAQHSQQQLEQHTQAQQSQQQLQEQLNGCTLHDTGMGLGQQQQQHEGPAGLSSEHVNVKVQPESANGAAAVEAVAASDVRASGVSASAQALEDAHVHQVYDVIASHFSSTRFAVWPKVRAFLDSLAPGSVVADVGCGNGKYLGVRHDLAMLGSDRSAGLAAVAAARLEVHPAPAADVFVCDALQTCYRPCSCDAVLSIAVLHHISSRQRRLALLQQLAAVLRPGGRGLVTVWATQQEDPAKTIQRWHRIRPQEEVQAQQQQQQQEGQVVEGPDYFVPWHLPFHKAGALAASSQQQQQQQQPGAVSNGAVSGSDTSIAAAAGHPPSLAVDESKRAVVLQRYYHLFEEGELEGLVDQVPGLEVVQVFYDHSNWCVEFRKQA